MLNDQEIALVQNFFAFFGFDKDSVKVEVGEADMITITLQVNENETGRYIGRFGETLDSLQLIVSLMLNNGKELHRHVLLDVGGYRQERKNTLKNMADQAAEEVLATGAPHALPPLTSTDRRQVHLFFQDHATLTTYSEGEGQNRRLVIAPRQAT